MLDFSSIVTLHPWVERLGRGRVQVVQNAGDEGQHEGHQGHKWRPCAEARKETMKAGPNSIHARTGLNRGLT